MVELERQGKTEEAIAEYREAIRLDSGHGHGAPQPRLRVWRDRESWRRRSRSYREAIRLDSHECQGAHYNLGVVSRNRASWRRRSRSIARRSGSTREDAGAHGSISESALCEQGKHEEATAEFREAIRLDPRRCRVARANLGNVFYNQGKHRGGGRGVSRGDPARPRENAARRTDLGIALANQGKHEEAIAEYREAIRLDPGHARSHVRLGSAREPGKLEEAIKELREAIRLDPTYCQSAPNPRESPRETGQAGGGHKELREAIRIEPNDAGAHGTNLRLCFTSTVTWPKPW